MTPAEFQELFVEISEKIADEYYPKGSSDRRGEYLRDQGILHAKLSEALTQKGVLREGLVDNT